MLADVEALSAALRQGDSPLSPLFQSAESWPASAPKSITHEERPRRGQVGSLSLGPETRTHTYAEEKPVSVLSAPGLKAAVLLCARWLRRGVRCRRPWLPAKCKPPTRAESEWLVGASSCWTRSLATLPPAVCHREGRERVSANEPFQG